MSTGTELIHLRHREAELKYIENHSALEIPARNRELGLLLAVPRRGGYDSPELLEGT